MSQPSPDVFIGVDLGTSSLKAVAVTSLGNVVARESEPYPTFRPEDRASEQDPASWLAALGTSLERLAEQVPAQRWQALGLSAMIPTLVLTNEDGTQVGPAITWEDGRAEREGEQLRDDLGTDWLYRETGQWVDGRYLLPMILRIKRADPTRFGNARWALGAKDYLFWYLTRTRATDPSTATGFGCYGLHSGTWLAEVTDAAGVLADTPMPALPAVEPSTHVAVVAAEAGRQLPIPVGLPVVLGAADSVMAAFGLGVQHGGDVAYVAGTSTVILGVSDSLTLDPGHRFLVTPMALPGSWGLEMDQLATGSALRWLGELLGVSAADVVDRAASSTSETVPLFLPFLAPGEQGALWDPSLTGSITGLTVQHNAADVARGLLTGMILESRRSLALMADVTGTRGDIRITGAGASSPLFQQDLADATGRAVIVSDEQDHSAIGAALVAAEAVGASVSPDRATADRASAAHIVMPNRDVERLWDERFAAHDAMVSAMQRLGEPGSSAGRGDP
jgi:sugar (pentulose or hexulose) kinase